MSHPLHALLPALALFDGLVTGKPASGNTADHPIVAWPIARPKLSFKLRC